MILLLAHTHAYTHMARSFTSARGIENLVGRYNLQLWLWKIRTHHCNIHIHNCILHIVGFLILRVWGTFLLVDIEHLILAMVVHLFVQFRTNILLHDNYGLGMKIR